MIKYAYEDRNEDILQQSQDDGKQRGIPEPTLVVDRHDALPEIDVTIQGVSVKAAMSYLVKLVSPANPEVTATIFKANSGRRTYVSLPVEMLSKTDDASAPLSSPIIVEGSDSDSDAAFKIGCMLIWSQSTVYRDDANRQEFCDWVKLLRIKSSLDAAQSTSDHSTVTEGDLDFLKNNYERAINGKIDYHNIISTLYGAEKFVGDQAITVGTKTTTIEAASDLMRYFGVIGNTEGRNSDWRDKLPDAMPDRRVMDEVFFAGTFASDCKEGVSKYQNVVRIVIQQPDSRIVPNLVVLSGVVVRDDTVLTFYQRLYPSLQTDDALKNVKVQTISCGAVTGEFAVTGATTLIGEARQNTFMQLKVHGLKVLMPLPEFDFDTDNIGGDGVEDVTITGFIRDRSSMFGEASLPLKIENDERFNADATKVKKLPPTRTVVSQRVLFDSPFATGMVGSPIYVDGKIVGMAAGGIPVNIDSRLRLTYGVSLLPIKSALLGLP